MTSLSYQQFIVRDRRRNGYYIFPTKKRSCCMEELAPFGFSHLETSLECFSSRDGRDVLLQWNLDACLQVEKFRFTGNFSSTSAGEYDRLLRDFIRSDAAAGILQFSGSVSTPLRIEAEQLSTSVMDMTFFDRLMDEVAPNGHIRGCFEEVYEGISAGDQLREMLVNVESERSSLFSEDDKKQLIFRIFKIFAVGGAMCQPETTIERYLNLTKALYKESVTVYRDSKTNQVQVSGRVYSVQSVSGLSIFPVSDSPHNALYLVIDPLKRHVLAIKMNFKPFW